MFQLNVSRWPRKYRKVCFFNRLIYLVYVKYYTKNCLDDYDELFL
jgi:hypothetical protein